VVKGVPVLAGVCATDPFRRMDYFLRQLEAIGFCGVQNFPTVGLFDGNFRQNLEETGMGYRYSLSRLNLRNAISHLVLLFLYASFYILMGMRGLTIVVYVVLFSSAWYYF
jgi:predicted TIM-barrel enzyme